MRKISLTFGVEFECVFAFHQSLPQDHLDAIGYTSESVITISTEAGVISTLLCYIVMSDHLDIRVEL